MGKKPAQKSADSAKKVVHSKSDKPKKVAKVAKVEVRTEAKADACKIKGCKREYRSKGYCVAHYRKWRNGQYGIARYKTCNSNDCRKPMTLNRHGLCEDHYQKLYVKGEKVAAAAPEAKPADKTAAAS